MKHLLLSLFFLASTYAAYAQEEQPEEIFTIVTVQPQYKGGWPEFYKYIMKNMQYPAYARQNGIEGKVYVQYVIDTNGAVVSESVVVHKGVHESLDNEAVRLLKECPDWIPGRSATGPAKVRMIVPITFKLDSMAAKKKKGN